MHNRSRPKAKQKGAVVILMAFIIGLGVLAYLLNAFDPARLRLEQDKRTMQSLNAAKQALIAWAVSHPTNPGQFPYPDRREVVSPNYDGKSDCPPSGTAFNLPGSYALFLGQLPISGQDAPCESPLLGLSEELRDAQGNRLWYAVSRNLVHHYEFLLADPNSNPIINPSIVDSPTYPWLRMLDRNGVLISDRVAVVIIAPGNALAGQNRTGVAPTANQYLDTFTIGATNYSNANYVMPNEDFIIGQDSRDVTEADMSVIKPYYFNDKLIFITIDELIAAITSRASGEASKLLNQYRAKNGQFPYASNLGATFNNHNSSGISTKGMLPIDVTDACSCSSAANCSCSFQPILSVTLYRNAGTWDTAEDLGFCSSAASPKNCTCTGAGSCSRFGTNFSCTNLGNCTHNLPSTPLNEYTYKLNNHADFNNATLGCAIVTDTLPRDTAECNDMGNFTIGLREPDWFKKNLWQDYFYYEWSPAANLQVGGKTGVGALLISTGAMLASTEAQPLVLQSRPSININDYLDSIQNTNNDLVFDATNRQKSNNYNDQAYIVMP